ncbi:RHS repeat-associated core domain-containing protein [Streptomyces mirabilis]|uniref:RHS repeat-associated core domain-containing protein n=1 Tax=Streptomyces mirabilis TaxID=68239 RepID=UPI0036F1E89B
MPNTWTGDKGFVGGTNDTATALTHLGAREYDPATGRFLSVDPVFTATDPQQMNGYTYANNNPLTYSDPAGTEIGSKPNSCQYDVKYCSKHQQQEVGYDAKTGTSDYHRGNIYKRSRAAKKTWVAVNTPVTNDLNTLADNFWSPRSIGEGTEGDFWFNPAHENTHFNGSACYGREGCAQAYLYVLHGGKSVKKAKEIAATYCVYNAAECSSKARAVARGNVIEEAIGIALLGYLGGAAGSAEGEAAESPASGAVRKGAIPDQVPHDYYDEITLRAAKHGAGEVIIRDLGDAPRLEANYGPGEWVKMESTLDDAKGKAIRNVHWFRNLDTGMNVEFKFKRDFPQMEPNVR